MDVQARGADSVVEHLGGLRSKRETRVGQKERAQRFA
jgi:hypothetical protein